MRLHARKIFKWYSQGQIMQDCKRESALMIVLYFRAHCKNRRNHCNPCGFWSECRDSNSGPLEPKALENRFSIGKWTFPVRSVPEYTLSAALASAASTCSKRGCGRLCGQGRSTRRFTLYDPTPTAAIPRSPSCRPQPKGQRGLNRRRCIGSVSRSSPEM